MNTKKVVITAGLPYSNGDIHVGHVAGCYLPADIVNRYFKLNGRETLYVCGTDDHGVAIVMSGLKEGKTPEEMVHHYHERQRKAFEGLDIRFDVFGSTSKNPYHREISNDFFLKIYEKGYFSKEKSLQFYDEKSKMFLPDRYVKGDCAFCGALDQTGDQCENCGKILDVDALKNPRSALTGAPVGKKETVHWFLDLSKAEGQVKKWLENAVMKPDTKTYVESLLHTGLVKRSMTRDINWGLPVPLNDPDAKNKVMYVWFDAPIGYISNTKQLLIDQGANENAYHDWWKGDAEIYHFIGEDNTVFHCVIWIAMLNVHGGYRLPKGVIVNKFMNIKKGDSVEKISKSRKNAIWILDYLADGNDPDYLRYYLTINAPEKSRSNFDYDEFMALCNSELADTLGNFINRSLSFSLKFLGEHLPIYDETLLTQDDRDHLESMKKCFAEIATCFEAWSTRRAMITIFDFARLCNKYFNDRAPWSTRKTNIELTKVTLAISLQSIYFLGAVLRPFFPTKSKGILQIFGVKEDIPWKDALKFPEGGTTLHKMEILFKKIEAEAPQA